MLTIDELHYVDRPTMTALIVGLHRAAQLTLPITVAGAGLPTLMTVTGDAKTYAERMFTFPQIGSLTWDQAVEALQAPALDEGVTWSDAALNRVLEMTECFPYFLQQFGQQAWDIADGPSSITVSDVERSIPVVTAQLDDGFFRVRTGSTSESERAYLRAMAEFGPGSLRTSDVAAALGKKAQGVGPVRDALIKRGLCYSSRYGEIAFTVPLFDEYMKRWIPGFPSR